ncbi:amidohydrolase [Nocardioides zhouii]|uniref:Amidohydrolase n=1 Tax=Nocardioides zhouii TaxID=1168729 RepID=A0A4Q2SSR9_9ACTN|nr:amidohydrolase [Nocardioides zhouii]RYC07318.1 amidohydrolase [Nocardioides zhouii]
MLIRDARLVALTDATAGPVDVRIEDGRVTEVGPSLDTRGDEGAYDAGGRWLMPGLWDQHVHLGQWTLASARLDLAGVRSSAEAVAAVRERLEEWPDLPVIGWGHRPTAWPDNPAVSDLDAIDTDQPIVLIAGDGHHGWLNTIALHMLALSTRDSMVSEGEWFQAYGRLAGVMGSDGTGPDAYRRSMEAAAAQGVVGLVDLEFSGGVADWVARWSAGADLLRIRHACYADGLDDVLARGLRSGDPLADSLPDGGGRLTMGPLKIISDGSLNTRTAWCREPYAEKAVPGSESGQPNQTATELRSLLARAAAGGLDVAVHAIGDRAVTEALDAFEETGARGGIEHVQLTTRDDVRRLAALGVRASVQPAHLLDDRDVTERLWPGRAERCFPLRWMVDAGVDVVLGSDAPVSPLDPWLAVAAAVHRSADEREPWHPEQAITAREALAASTDGWGTVAAGHPADLVLLDADPLAGDSGREHALALRAFADRVVATWVAGSPVYERA